LDPPYMDRRPSYASGICGLRGLPRASSSLIDAIDQSQVEHAWHRPPWVATRPNLQGAKHEGGETDQPGRSVGRAQPRRAAREWPAVSGPGRPGIGRGAEAPRYPRAMRSRRC
jgi:hypothetical protein